MTKAANEIIKKRSLKELCEMFTETNNNRDENIPTVRGWIMDELEIRDTEKFNAWMDTEDIDAMDHPEKFYL